MQIICFSRSSTWAKIAMLRKVLLCVRVSVCLCLCTYVYSTCVCICHLVNAVM